MTHLWHSWLGMPKYDKTWHESDMADELAEYAEERALFKKMERAERCRLYLFTGPLERA